MLTTTRKVVFTVAALSLLSQPLLSQLSFTENLASAQQNANSLVQLPLSCKFVPVILSHFKNRHFKHDWQDAVLEKRTIEEYLESLDPTQSLLKADDVKKITAHMAGILGKVGKDCSSLKEANDILVTRLEEAEKAAASLVAPANFTIDENAETPIGRKKRHWPKNDAEWKTMRKNMVMFQLAADVATQNTLDEAKKRLIRRYQRQIAQQKKFKEENLNEFFLNSFARSLDPHSSFMGQEDADSFKIAQSLQLEGIGVTLKADDGYTVITEVRAGGPAAQAGTLEKNDKIMAVAQKDKKFESIVDMPLREVVQKIRGPKQTEVNLMILRTTPKGPKNLTVTLVRDRIDLEDEAAQLFIKEIDRGGKKIKVGIIELQSFYGDMQAKKSCGNDVRQFLIEAKAKGVDTIVLDLSRNSGGLLAEAIRISGLFFKKGAVVGTRNTEGRVEIRDDKDAETVWNGPLVVLTSRLSASASEIVAGALQSYHRALIVGTDRTFGKGSVQVVQEAPFGLGLFKVTIEMFFLPSGVSTQNVGVSADLKLPSQLLMNDDLESSLPYALDPAKIPTFLSNEVNDTAADARWKPVTTKLIAELKKKSEVRVKNDPEFQKIEKELKSSKKTKGVVKVSEILSKKDQKDPNDPENKPTTKEGQKEKYLKRPEVVESAEISIDLKELEK